MRNIGKVKDAHGLKGELYILLFTDEFSWFKKIEKFCLINIKNNEVLNLTVERLKPHKDGIIIKPREFNDRNQTEAVKGFLFSIDESFFVSEPGEDIFLGELLGFSVWEKSNFLGEVSGFFDNGAQDLLQIKKVEMEFEVPFVEEFIEEVDFETKKIKVRLPEGLIEVNQKTSEQKDDGVEEED